jgi:hypothetical protein
MRLLIRLVALLAAISVAGTLWLVATFAATGRLGMLLASGPLGIMTITAWMVALVTGPIAAVQLWHFRVSGRLAGLVFFGSGLLYSGVGLWIARSTGAPTPPIVTAAAAYMFPLGVLLSPGARRVFNDRTAELDNWRAGNS